MKCKDNIQEIERHLTTWFILIAASNALSYFDINKISEGTALYLLNLLYDFKLKDLNNVIENYPGIDVGDTSAVGIAFQITSRTDIGAFDEKAQQKK